MVAIFRPGVRSAFRPVFHSSYRGMSTTTTAPIAPLLVSPKDIDHNTNVVFLDASWHMPGSPRDPRQEYTQKHISGARFLDLDEIASKHELGLKHMMPSPELFAHAMGQLGITRSSHVVVYDTHGVFSSPRALFMLRAFGHKNSSVLNGGLPRWTSEGLSITDKTPTVQPTEYDEPILNEDVIRSYEQIVENSRDAPAADPKYELVLDARSRGRWLGIDPEPRPGLSSGHIPHSFSLPFNNFLKTVEDTGTGSKYTLFRSVEEIEQEVGDVLGTEFLAQAKKGERTVVTSCGSGMSAGVLWLGLQLLQVGKVGLYDESWTGYASRKDSVIQKAT